MGQGTSKTQGSLTVGYIVIPNSDQVHPEKREVAAQDDDLVLSKPHWYALTLAIHRPLAPIAEDRLGRVDSGYCEDFYDEKLSKDLEYVDNTYYDSRFRPSLRDDGSDMEVRNQPIRFTVKDALGGSGDKLMQEIDLSARRLVSLSSNVGRLTSIRRLDLSHNQLTRLPDAIGCLENLEILRITNNDLMEIPETISCLSSLVELDVSHNHLTELGSCFRAGANKKFHTLKAAHNRITRLSPRIVNLSHLTILDLSNNDGLRVLPAEITQLPYLRWLQLEGCQLSTKVDYSLQHNPPSLREICARTVVRQRLVNNSSRLPAHLLRYLDSAELCTSCRGPYFESYVVRGQWAERPEMLIPLEHRLCSAHWLDENDRLLYMFASQPRERKPLTKRCPLPSSPSLDGSMTTIQQEHESETTATATTTTTKFVSRWRSQRKKVTNNRSTSHGFLSLTKLKRPRESHGNPEFDEEEDET